MTFGKLHNTYWYDYDFESFYIFLLVDINESSYTRRGRFTAHLEYDWLMMITIMWRCCQLLSRDFIVNKMTPSVREFDLERCPYV